MVDHIRAADGNTSAETFLAPNQAFDSEAADDFVVPPGVTWTLTDVEVRGTSTGFSRYGTPFRVRVYNSSGSAPGSTVLLDRTSTAGGSGGSYLLPLTGAPALPPGTYWLSVQSIAGSSGGAQWFWDRTTSPEADFFAVWRNPGNGFGKNCPAFSSACLGPGGKDLTFRLTGNQGAASGQPVPSFVGTIPLPADTQVLGIGTSARYNKVFAADDNSGNLFIIDGASHAILGQIFVGGTAFDVVVDDKHGRVYVASNTSSSTTGLTPGTGLISVIDAATNQLVTTINLYAPAQPVVNTSFALKLDEGHDKLYVMYRNPFEPGVVTIDTSTNAVDVIESAPENLVSFFPVGLNRQTQEFVIGNTRDRQLAFVNGATGTTSLFNLEPTGAATPLDIVVNERENKVYVTMLKVPNQGEIGIMILDRDTMNYSFVGKDDVEPLAYNPATNRVFSGVQVGSHGAVIEGATDQFTSVPLPGGGIGFIAVREASDYAYMTSRQRIYALHGGSKLVWSIPMSLDGDFGNDLAINQRTGRVYIARYGGQPGIVVLQDPIQLRSATGDYDGNGTTDIAVYRPSTGQWFVRNGVSAVWGASGDIAVPGDYDGNGSADIAVYRPSTGAWFVRNGVSAVWGTSGDIPVPGDYDGNGSADIAVYRPSTGAWFVRNGVSAVWGASGDIAVPVDYDGNGTTDIAVYRPSTGAWFVRNGVSAVWGANGDIPVPGDYDGNGTTDIAVYRPSTGQWFVRNGVSAVWGASGDRPAPLPDAIGRFFP